MSTSAASRYVTFKGGFVAWWPVVERLLDLESRGCSFQVVEGGRFRVSPSDYLTPDDVDFLQAHYEEARRVLEYTSDDAHVFSDARVEAVE